MRNSPSRRLLVAGALWAGVLFSAFDLWVASGMMRNARVQNDFRLAYMAARLVARQGWPVLYDFAAQQAEAARLGFNWQPYVTPPPLVALALPLSALPFEAALGLWSALLTASLVAAWALAAPGRGIERWMHLALALGLFPAAFAVAVGQPAPLVMLAVAACWAFLRRGRDGLAGLCLAAIALKPQLGLLLPLALLAAGRYRAFATALAALAALAAVSAALLGPGGITAYRTALSEASTWALTRRFTITDVLPGGLPAAQAAIAALTAIAAWRGRRNPEVPLAGGLVGSLLVTPYIGLQDFTMLLVAAWLLLRLRPARALVALLAAGYALLEFALLEPSLPLVLWRALLLASLAAWPPGAPQVAAPSPGADGRPVAERTSAPAGP